MSRRENDPPVDAGAGERRDGAPAGHAIRRTVLHDEVIRRLRDMIFEGELAPGDRIPEREFCERFGISRTPLRQAVMVLAAEGLIDLSPHRGATVSRLEPESLDHMFQVMESLEGLAGRLACQQVTDAELAELRSMHQQMCEHFERGERLEYFRLNQRIHQTIVEIARNPILADVYGSLSGRIRRARYLANMDGERWRQAVEEHERMLALLAERDGEALSALLVEHLRHKRAALETVLFEERTP